MQAGVTGTVLSGLVPSFTNAISGGLLRQRQTLAGVIGAFDEQPSAVVDEGWDEYDLAGLMNAPTAAEYADGRNFNSPSMPCSTDWITGELDAAEPFEEYARRVAAAGQRAVDEAGSGRNVLVVSSAGTIALWLAQHLGLDARHWPPVRDDDERLHHPLHRREKASPSSRSTSTCTFPTSTAGSRPSASQHRRPSPINADRPFQRRAAQNRDDRALRRR